MSTRAEMFRKQWSYLVRFAIVCDPWSLPTGAPTTGSSVLLSPGKWSSAESEYVIKERCSEWCGVLVWCVGSVVLRTNEGLGGRQQEQSQRRACEAVRVE